MISMDKGSAFVLGSKGQIERHEFLRLIIQYLYSLGFNRSASLLESESGIHSKSVELALLESQILSANWEECVAILNGIEGLDEDTGASALFLVFKQCIMEFLNRGDDSSALNVLQRRVSELRIDRERVHKIASGFVSLGEIGFGKVNSSPDELRRKLLVELESMLPPPIVVPERRVEMALIAKRDSCMYHNSVNAMSLYEDYCCGRDQFPAETLQILNHHENEVWFVQFSNNGEYLASSSSDRTAIIWKVSEEGILSFKHCLRNHQNPVSFVAWSPDDTMLLTCGNGEVLKLWDVESGKCKHAFGETIPVVSSCAWFPDSKRLSVAALIPTNASICGI